MPKNKPRLEVGPHGRKAALKDRISEFFQAIGEIDGEMVYEDRKEEYRHGKKL